MKPFSYLHWHVWQGTTHIMLSNEATKTLRQFDDVDACITWLWLNGNKPAAQELNNHSFLES